MFSLFIKKNWKILLNTGVLPQNLLDPTWKPSLELASKLEFLKWEPVIGLESMEARMLEISSKSINKSKRKAAWYLYTSPLKSGGYFKYIWIILKKQRFVSGNHFTLFCPLPPSTNKENVLPIQLCEEP